jgi:hypothetical protein
VVHDLPLSGRCTLSEANPSAWLAAAGVLLVPPEAGTPAAEYGCSYGQPTSGSNPLTIQVSVICLRSAR